MCRRPYTTAPINLRVSITPAVGLPLATISLINGSGYWDFLSPQYASRFLNCFLASPLRPDTSVRDLWMGSDVHSRYELASSAFLALRPLF